MKKNQVTDVAQKDKIYLELLDQINLAEGWRTRNVNWRIGKGCNLHRPSDFVNHEHSYWCTQDPSYKNTITEHQMKPNSAKPEKNDAGVLVMIVKAI